MKLVFVSSTFKDMQFERDALNTYVAPLIDSHLAPFGETVYFGDLRWGVNTTELDSEESSKKVLDVCLDEIDNCKPYMIVLIGERYGWIPGAELLHTAAVTKGVNTPTDISVTQLEIEYGALLNPDYEGRILFYFRSVGIIREALSASLIFSSSSIDTASSSVKPDALTRQSVFITPPQPRAAPISAHSVRIYVPFEQWTSSEYSLSFIFLTPME